MAEQRLDSGQTTDLALEIAHLLFIDVVGYSKLLVNDEIELMQELNRIVRGTPCFRDAEASEKMIRLPTGDGMVLLFFRSPEQPVHCALQVSEALRDHPQIQLRMGIHSGPVNEIVDVNDQINIAGAGLNIGQRVMDCGDAGHILLSKHIAEDLAQYRHWQPHLHDLGECDVKHGARLHIVNLHKDGLGNPAIPEKLKGAERWRQTTGATPGSENARRWPKFLRVITLFSSGVALVVSFALLLHRGTLAPQKNLPTLVPEKSIAVLPFENRSEEKANAYFADAIQDEILTRLSRIADLKVISRTSTQHYRSAPENLRDVAWELGVAHIVEGSVQKSGNAVRVNVQLIKAADDSHIWAQTFDEKLTDIFSVESDIAKKIADQLEAKISPSEAAAIEKAPTTDLSSYDLYERAKRLWTEVSDPVQARGNLPQAAHLLDESVARDPHFLQAWCLLSRIHGALFWYGFDRSPARLNLAHAAVQTALRLQPGAGEAHLALAIYYYYGFLDYGRARNELTIARRTLPNNAEVFEYTGYIGRREGNWEESERNLTRALELDPRNIFTLKQLANSYRSQHRYGEELRTLDRVLAIVPGDPSTRIDRAQVTLDWRADIKPYQVTLAALIDENPSIGPDVDSPDYSLCERMAAAAARLLTNYPEGGLPTNDGVNSPHSYWEAVVARWNGNLVKASAAFATARIEVKKIVDSQPDFAPAVSLLGVIDAGLGLKEEALREGRRACELLPISKDAISGSALAVNLAQIYTWTSEKDLAIDQLALVERGPNQLSYGLLKLHPYWDSLRGDPRFEKIVASLAPKP